MSYPVIAPRGALDLFIICRTSTFWRKSQLTVHLQATSKTVRPAMSSQKGNIHKARAQKHQNKSAFKNNLHDTSWKTKQINNVVTAGVCQRCKDALDWKIKYKKYKPLSQPRTCNTCHEKAVKQAYYTICVPCAQARAVCQKCGEKKEVVLKPTKSDSELAAEGAMLHFELKQLSERQRRSFFRLQASGKLTSETSSASNHGDGCYDNSGSEESCDEESEDGCHGNCEVDAVLMDSLKLNENINCSENENVTDLGSDNDQTGSNTGHVTDCAGDVMGHLIL